MSEWSEFDIRCMRLALEQAEKGCGKVSPNPPVGCVLASGGEIVASGWHDHLGGLHAEQAAIADAEERGLGNSIAQTMSQIVSRFVATGSTRSCWPDGVVTTCPC